METARDDDRGLPPRVRPMRESDLPIVLRIERQSYPRPWPAFLFRRLLRGHGTTLRVLEMDRQVVGYGIMQTPGRWAHILNVAVAPGQRGRGLGRRLMVQLLAEARAAGARRVWLEVRPTGRRAIRLYRKLGFQRVGRRPRYYRERGSKLDAVVMTRGL